MDKIIAIMQPTYLPWIGYFNMIDKVDEFVFLDDVQLVKRSWGVRNRVKSSNGELLLTVPIKKTKSRAETLYSNAIINYEEQWVKKHLNTLKFSYTKAKYFNEIFVFIREILERNTNIIGKLNIEIIKEISSKIGIKTKFFISSELTNIEGIKDERLVSICKNRKATHYLSAIGSAAYIEYESSGGAFSKKNVQLNYYNYKHPVYEQLYGDFISNMSIVDLLFNYGFSNSLELISKGY